MVNTILQALTQVDTLPMHMPGHKRNTDLAPYLKALGADLDITEITQCDNLHQPQTIIAQAMTKAQVLWGAEKSFLLVGGSTCGILAALHATTQPGDKVVMMRGCHKSVYNAMALCQAKPVYLAQGQTVQGYPMPVEVQAVAQALQDHPDAKVLVLTSPTYEGYHADLPAMVALCHRQGVAVVVDQAHGAHLGFSPGFLGAGVPSGADIVVQSLHKTLPSLTQTAIAHLQGDLVDQAQFARSLAVFETSSPSYLLLASIDGCLALLLDRGPALFAQWESLLKDFYHQCAPLNHLAVVTAPPGEKDPGKVVISTVNANVHGQDLKELLYKNHKIELELAYGDYALAMTGLGDVAENLQALAQALRDIDQTLASGEGGGEGLFLPPLPQVALPAHALHKAPLVAVPVAQAVGRICGDYLWAYPPGVPLVVPGEVVSQGLVAVCQGLEGSQTHLQDTCGFWPQAIGCVATEA